MVVVRRETMKKIAEIIVLLRFEIIRQQSLQLRRRS